MAIDRDGTLKKAEKLLKQGRLDAAIDEYLRVVEDNPRDWSTANTLGELYARHGQAGKAIEQYNRIAEHFVDQGFYSKAGALFKKTLKLNPQDESTQLRLADVSARQGLLADAKAYLNAVGARRLARGDRRGQAEVTVRLGSIDPADFDARFAAARTLGEMGEDEEASARFKSLHADLIEKGRDEDARTALAEYVTINPLDREARGVLAKAALSRGDLGAAREYLDEHTAGEDPALLLALAEIDLRAGEVDRARPLVLLLARDGVQHEPLMHLAGALIADSSDAAYLCVDAVVDAATAAGRHAAAVSYLQGFVAERPGQIPALLRLVEVCVDAGLETTMYEAQTALTDAYLSAGRGAEARAIAEDLVAREPWELTHIDRFRQALVMLRVSDPDTLIAARLSGEAPFMARDPFFDAHLTSGAPDRAAESEAVAAEPGGASRQPVDPDAALFVDNSGAEHRVVATPVARPAPSQPSPPNRPADLDTGEIDLSEALGGNDGRGAAPAAAAGELDQIFASARDAARTDPDFSGQHMTLARTYLEIGMEDEAMAALQTAARSPGLRFEAAQMLGRLYERRREPAKAIEWLERAAAAAAPDGEQARTVRYDLGVLLDQAGETSRALAVFLELQADAGDYRDVPSRIDRLAGAQS